MNEIAVVFGSNRHLVGTLTLPDATTQAVAFVLLNAGVIHRIGPHRFNVKLARELSKGGFASLRFDISSQGDSSAPAQGLPYERQAVADLQAAMDHMERVCGVKHFVIAGICSGAHNGLATAQVDPRVVGLWMMDGYIYPSAKTTRARQQYQLEKRPLATLSSWALRALSMVGQRLLKPFKGSTSTVPTAVPAIDYGHTTPPREAYASLMQSLVDRGVDIYLMFSGSMLWYYSYADQLRDAFAGHAFVQALRCDYVPEIDHTLTTLASQRQVIKAICDWAPSVRGTPNHGT